MTQSVHEVADRLRAVADDRGASQLLLESLFAESVELYHEPPLPTDGPIPGSLIAEAARLETEAVERALSTSLETKSEVTVEADAVHMTGRVTGALADGTAVDVHTDVYFRIADGQIVGLRSNMDEQSMASWGQVLAAGGFEMR